MQITLDLSAEMLQGIKEQAEAKGLSVERYLEAFIYMNCKNSLELELDALSRIRERKNAPLNVKFNQA